MLHNHHQIQAQNNSKEVILIRHGQSNFNQGYLNYINAVNPSLIWYDCIKIPEFNEIVSYSKDYLDCSITPQGKNQCKKAKDALKDHDIDIVLVSPLRRALQTCHQIFGDRNVKVEVHPILSEVFRYSCDISEHIDEKIRDYPHFDYSILKDHSQLWSLDLLGEHHQEKCSQHLQTDKELSYSQKQQKLLQLLSTKAIFETPQELRERTWKIKDLLESYSRKYKKVAVVSHFELLSTLMSKGFKESGQVSKYEIIQNAKPYFVSVDELQSVK